MFLATHRYQDLHEQLSPEQQSWPMSPLRIKFVQEGLRRGVGREALILACLLETEAVTFIPEIVAEAWVTLRKGSSAAGQVLQSTTDRRDHRGSQTLLDLCGVLEQLPKFLKCVFGQMDENATEECTRQMQRQRQKLVDVKVSERRLRRAIDLWWKILDKDTWAPSALSSA
jgi:hypothetical protein